MTLKAIVTGHSRGLGAALATELEARGWSVLGISRSTGEAVDLSDPTALAAWLGSNTLRDFLKGADEVLLINNAGLLGPVTVAGAQDAAAVTTAVNVNVTAPILLTNAVLATRPEGVPTRVVHVSSGAGRRPIAGWSVYCATKAAVDQHALTVAAEALPGVRIAAIAPGVVDTGMQAEIRASDDFPGREGFVELKEGGKLLSPREAASRLLAIALGDDFGTEVLTRI